MAVTSELSEFEKLFELLDEKDKQEYFNEKSTDIKFKILIGIKNLKLFKSLSIEEKIQFFKLYPDSKSALFTELNKNEQKQILDMSFHTNTNIKKISSKEKIDKPNYAIIIQKYVRKYLAKKCYNKVFVQQIYAKVIQNWYRKILANRSWSLQKKNSRKISKNEQQQAEVQDETNKCLLCSISLDKFHVNNGYEYCNSCTQKTLVQCVIPDCQEKFHCQYENPVCPNHMREIKGKKYKGVCIWQKNCRNENCVFYHIEGI